MAKSDNLSKTQTTGADLTESLGISDNDPVNLFSIRSKVQLKNDFVLMFYENFARLVELLTKRELRVLMAILRFLEYQNVFKITQKTLAKYLEVDEANISRAMKTLRGKKIISVDEFGTEYVNPYIFAKGNMLQIKKQVPELAKLFDGQLELLGEDKQKIIAAPY